MAEKNTQPNSASKDNTKTENVSEEALKKLSDQLLCSVCLNEYYKPRALPCLHVFCETCLKKMVEKQREKQSIPCPNCRKSVALPQGGVSSLPAAFYIQHLFELKETLEKVCSPNKTPCEKCGEGEIKGFCRDCGQLICQLCVDMHHKWKELQSHKISSLDEVQDTTSMMMTPKTNSDQNCDLNRAELATVDEIITELKARSIRLDRRGVEDRANVDSEVDKLQAILEARRKDLHSEIDSKVCQGKKEMEAQIDQHESRRAQLRSCVACVEGSLQSNTQEEVLSMKKSVELRAQNKFKSWQLQLGREQALRVVSTCLSQAHTILREVKFEWAPFQGTHVKNIEGVKYPRQIAFATTGEMVVCGWDANCVTVFDSSYKCLRTFGNVRSDENRLIKPKGVAISSDNIMFVTSNHCVKKFTLEGRFIASVGSQGSGTLQFNIPCAIAYNPTSNRVYVCDTHNSRIAILNHDLTFHDSFGSKGMEITQLHRPEGIAVDNKGNVFVADYSNHRIQIYDESGHYLSSITGTIPGQNLHGPHSVSVGPDDCVYVVEHDANRVSVFDDSGTYIKSFGKAGKKDGEFNKPYAVTVVNDGYVYVSDTGNRRVQVFK
jgi:tripartite motif-containing protein 2/3/tripartite motif-containing protein 71